MSQTGKRWVAGAGLISSDREQEVSSVLETVASYQRVVRSQGLWISFSQPAPVNTDTFSQLEALMAEDVRVTGN